MHVVFLTDTQKSGGATIAARRQMQALASAGVRVTQIVHRVENAHQPWSVEPLEDATFSLPRKIERRILPFSLSQQREDERASAALSRQLERLRPNIISAHNLHSAARFGWRWNLLETAHRFAPVVWTLHDEWSFSGRCAYSYDCQLFESGCDARCPTPREYPALEPNLIAPAWNARRAFFESNTRLAATAPSRWLAEKAARGLWRGHRVEVVANCLPLDVFAPWPQIEARRTLGLKADGPLLLASATDWSDRRKGGAVLQTALANPLLKGAALTILTLGAGQLDAPSGVETVALGMIEGEAQLARVYAAADFLVHPALTDNLPNVVLESFACGTPVVALPVGGLPELVSEHTGLLAEEATPNALAQAIFKALRTSGDERRELSAHCRQFAQTHFDPAQQADKLLVIFQQLIQENGDAPA